MSQNLLYTSPEVRIDVVHIALVTEKLPWFYEIADALVDTLVQKGVDACLVVESVDALQARWSASRFCVSTWIVLTPELFTHMPPTRAIGKPGNMKNMSKQYVLAMDLSCALGAAYSIAKCIYQAASKQKPPESETIDAGPANFIEEALLDSVPDKNRRRLIQAAMHIQRQYRSHRRYKFAFGESMSMQIEV